MQAVPMTQLGELETENRVLRARLADALWDDLLGVDPQLASLARLALELFRPYVAYDGDDGGFGRAYDGADADGFGAADGRGRLGTIGPYEVGSRELGRGTFGDVYPCRDASPFEPGAASGDLAMKVLLKSQYECAADLRKVAREVRAPGARRRAPASGGRPVPRLITSASRSRRSRSARGCTATAPSPRSSPRA
jgi:hypothetical protein